MPVSDSNGTAVHFWPFSRASARTLNAARFRAFCRRSLLPPLWRRPLSADLGAGTFLGVYSRPTRPSLGCADRILGQGRSHVILPTYPVAPTAFSLGAVVFHA